MGEFILDQAFFHLGGHDFAPDINNLTGSSAFETLDKTTFRNNGAREYRGGLFTTNLGMSGFADLSQYGNDVTLFNAQVGKTAQVVTVGVVEAEGSPCLITKAMVPTFNPGGGGQVGALSAFQMSGSGSDRYGAIRATQLVMAQTVSTTGAKGTGVQLGAVGADQRLFAALHLLGEPGTSITVVLESDDNSGFTSATTRGTFGPLTTSDGYWLSPVGGAIADTWWRFRVTAITGTWDLAASAAIE